MSWDLGRADSSAEQEKLSVVDMDSGTRKVLEELVWGTSKGPKANVWNIGRAGMKDVTGTTGSLRIRRNIRRSTVIHEWTVDGK